MRKWLALSVLGLAGVLGSANRASAIWAFYSGPYHTSALFPCVGNQYYTNYYYFAWYYPWYAYYNSSHGPYANWQQGYGFAYYANCPPGGCGPGANCGLMYGNPACGPNGCYAPAASTASTAPTGPPAAGTVSVTLPADARLLFNGSPAEGTGGTRTFRTPPLTPGQEYAYHLTAEVVRDGRVETATERVVVRAGEEAKVTLDPTAVRTAGK
jgi:uncharacterized protein (TIGR03000 family)